MKFVLQIHIDPKTGKAIPVPWVGEGEPPPLVEPMLNEPADGEPPQIGSIPVKPEGGGKR